MCDGIAPVVPGLEMNPRMNHEHRAVGMFGTLRADSTQEQSDEPAVTAASDNENLGVMTGFE